MSGPCHTSFSKVKAEQKKSYEIIYSQHMWLCTSPAYDTVHMRSIAIDIRLHKTVVTSAALTLAHRRQTEAVFVYLCIPTALLVLHVFNSCKHHKSYSPGSGG